MRTWHVESQIPEQQDQNRFIDATRKDLDAQQKIQAITAGLWRKVGASQSAEEKKVLTDSIQKVLYPQEFALQFSIQKTEIALMQHMEITDPWLRRMSVLSSCASALDNFPYMEETRALYQRMTPEQRNTEMGKEITVRLYPPKTVKVGDDLIDGDLYDLQGKVHHLADYKGKYLLLDFWSYGCGPCRQAMPEMREMAEARKDSLVIVSISTDNKSVWQKASKAEEMTWVNVNDLKGTTGLYAHYGVKGIPHYVLISPEGKLIHVWTGYGKGLIRSKLDKWMKR